MKVVSNSSPLIAFSRIDRLTLLPARFPEGILVPEAVWREVVQSGSGRTGAQMVGSADWIQIIPVQDLKLVHTLRADLDEGEAEAIVLASQEQADLILLDEKRGRQVARRLGLVTLGSVGLLIWAKQNGLIENLAHELDRLRLQGGFYLSESIISAALAALHD